MGYFGSVSLMMGCFNLCIINPLHTTLPVIATAHDACLSFGFVSVSGKAGKMSFYVTAGLLVQMQFKTDNLFWLKDN